MVVETATPRLVPPAPPEPEPEVDDSGAMDLQPRVVPAVELPERPGPSAALPSGPPFHPEVEEPTPSVRPPAGDRVELEAEWVPLRSSWQPSPQTWQPLADTWHQHRQALEPAAASPPAVPEPAARPTVFEFHSHPAEEPFPAPPHPDDLPANQAPRAEQGLPEVGAASRAAPEVSQTPLGLRGLLEESAPTDLPPVTASEENPEPGEEGSMDETSSPAQDPVGSVAPVAWPLLPLAWFNTAFDACVTPFGPLGRFLCGRAGRSFLGSLGLLGLAAAVALFAAFRIGWTW
jgi:hypothetical protein